MGAHVNEGVDLRDVLQPEAESKQCMARRQHRIVIVGASLARSSTVWRKSDEDISELAHAEPGPRGDVVATLVASRTDASPAARLLHPIGMATIPKTTMTDPFTHPGPRRNLGR